MKARASDRNRTTTRSFKPVLSSGMRVQPETIHTKRSGEGVYEISFSMEARGTNNFQRLLLDRSEVLMKSSLVDFVHGVPGHGSTKHPYRSSWVPEGNQSNRVTIPMYGQGT